MSNENKYTIGILGAGHIGKTLANKLSAAGHNVKVAHSGSPELIDSIATAHGAKAVWSSEVVKDVDVLITSIPLNRIPEVASLIGTLPIETVVIDTSNYYPGRDSKIAAIEEGQVESLWVQEHLGRPIAKAWNSIGSDSLARHGKAHGAPNRIAISVAGDRERDRKIAMQLVEDTGLDAYDAGVLSESWRQQPGNPAYCTDLSLQELPAKLATADREKAPTRRDLAAAVFAEKAGDPKTNPDSDFGVQVSRSLFF